MQEILDNGYPAYTTSAGWLGYSDEKVESLVRQSLENAHHMKIKVGRDIEDDLRRVAMVRQMVGPDIKLSIDANPNVDVNEPSPTSGLGRARCVLVEEPTSPDDILGFAQIARGVQPGQSPPPAST